jgi:hypothetical protein
MPHSAVCVTTQPLAEIFVETANLGEGGGFHEEVASRQRLRVSIIRALPIHEAGTMCRDDAAEVLRPGDAALHGPQRASAKRVPDAGPSSCK